MLVAAMTVSHREREMRRRARQNQQSGGDDGVSGQESGDGKQSPAKVAEGYCTKIIIFFVVGFVLAIVRIVADF